jgi:hypothetical protein
MITEWARRDAGPHQGDDESPNGYSMMSRRIDVLTALITVVSGLLFARIFLIVSIIVAPINLVVTTRLTVFVLGPFGVIAGDRYRRYRRSKQQHAGRGKQNTL